MAKIILSEMQFYGNHGCFEAEQIIGTRFTVDMSLQYDETRAALTDNIEVALNYVKVYECVQEVMDQPTHLLETLAFRIIRKVKTTFPQVQSVIVKVSKLNPPIAAQTHSVAVELEG